MEREAERDAFAKACAYLNYNASAKWSAHAAAACTGLLYVALLSVLWLFADLLVYRGQFPSYRALSPIEQTNFQTAWSELPEEAKVFQLTEIGLPAEYARKLATRKDELTPEQFEDCWRSQIGAILRKSVGWFELTENSFKALKDAKVPDDILDKLTPLTGKSYRYDQFLTELAGVLEEVRYDNLLLHHAQTPDTLDVVGRVARDPSDYDQDNNGLLSLMVRAQAHGSWRAPFITGLTRWNSWAWNPPFERGPFSAYLNGLLILGVVLAFLAALASWLVGEMAARACIEASNRLRRAVYLHTFRMGTLAFRALGPTEAVTVFTRHVEAVNDALYVRLTVYFRSILKFVLLVLFALVVHVALAAAFLIFAALTWMMGKEMVAFFTRRSRQATNEAGERLTEMRESLMMMRLVKCYLMEPFNRSRVERQMSHYADVQMVRYRSDAFYQPLLILLGTLCTILLLYVSGVVIFHHNLEVPRHDPPGHHPGQPLFAAEQLAGSPPAAETRLRFGRPTVQIPGAARRRGPDGGSGVPAAVGQTDRVRQCQFARTRQQPDAPGRSVADDPGRQANRPDRGRGSGETCPGLPDPAPSRPDLG